jgi:hypothetical protein
MSYQEQLRQNLAADADYRTTASDERWWTNLNGDTAFISVLYGTDEVIEDMWVKVKFEVCPACEGHGRYVNPSIDAHGLSSEDFDEDEDFRDNYFDGLYDVTCVLCHGANVVPVPLDEHIRDLIKQQANDRYMARAEQLAEMRMGA